MLINSSAGAVHDHLGIGETAGRTGTCCKSPSTEGAGGMELRGILLLRHCMVHTSSGPNLQWTVAKPGAMAKGLIIYPLNRSTSL
ncbi:hypothetical protein MHYP_G00177670 [Metynnis hypsauchen]